MKKFLLVLTTLALVGVGAFAADVGGEVYGSVYILQGDSSGDSDITATGNMTRLRLNLSGQNDDATLGGAMRIDANNLGFGKSGIMGSDNVNAANLSLKGYAWWRPNSIVMVGLGNKPGDWFGGREGALNAMWGGANDVLVADNGNNSGSVRLGDGLIGTQYAVTGGWGRWGAGMELTPIKGLKVNVGIPFMPDKGNTVDGNPIGQIVPAGGKTDMGIGSAVSAKNMYSNIFYQAVCDLDVINGWVALTYNPDKWTVSANPVDNGQIYATVDSKAIPNLELTASFGYKLPGKVDSAKIGPGSYLDTTNSVDVDVDNLATDFKTETTNHPVAVGLAGVYKNGPIGVNFRTVARFGGNDWGNDRIISTDKDPLYDGGDDGTKSQPVFARPRGTESPFRIMADLVPNYDVTDSIRAYLALGITSIGETKTEGDAKNIPGAFGWSVNPYVSLAIGGRVSLYGGVRVQSNGGYDSKGNDVWKEGNMDKGRDPLIQWAIPIGMSASF